MKFPMYITLTHPIENKFSINHFMFNTLDECLNKIIITVKNHINNKNVFPNDLEEFTNIHWYEDNIINNNIFDYNIYIDSDNEWKQPWTLQEIYQDVIEIINQIDIQNALLNPDNYIEHYEEEYDHEEPETKPESKTEPETKCKHIREKMSKPVREKISNQDSDQIPDYMDKLEKMLDEYLETQ